MKPCFLYRVVAPDGRAYIGVTKSPAKRFNAHLHRSSSAINAAIQEFGRSAMRFDILVCGPSEYVYELEEAAIRSFDTRHPNGFNLAPGGIGGRCNRDPLPSTRAKLSANAKLNTKAQRAATTASAEKRRGKPLSPETCAKISAANKGTKPAPQAIAAARAFRFRSGFVPWNKGVPMTTEVKAKLVSSMAANPKVLAAQKLATAAAACKPPWNKGKKTGPEQIAKMRAARLGKKLSSDSVRKRETTKFLKRLGLY